MARSQLRIGESDTAWIDFRVKIVNSLEPLLETRQPFRFFFGSFRGHDYDLSSRWWFLASDAIIVNNFPSSPSGCASLRASFVAILLFDVGNYPRAWANYTRGIFRYCGQEGEGFEFLTRRGWVKDPVCRIANFLDMILCRSDSYRLSMEKSVCPNIL